MIIPKVNIKNILSSDNSGGEKTAKEVNSKEQDKASASPKEYNKEECLNQLWIELISVLFDDNAKTSLKDLMSSKKYSNQSYIERSSMCESPKKDYSEMSNTSEMSNSVASPSGLSNKKSFFRLGGHSRTNSNSSISKKGSKRDSGEPEYFSPDEEVIFANSEEIIDASNVINLESKEFKQRIWECLFWSAGIEGLDTLLLRFIVAR